MKQYFKRDIKSLDFIFDTIHDFAKENKLSEKIIFVLNLASEEIFTNMIKYNSTNQNDILIDLVKDNDKIMVTFTDFDAIAFDINKVKTYDTNVSLKDRPIGKIGIHLVKKMIDDIKYEYKNRNSRITLIKYVG
jgi:anti-sigma regulatory factor (Ser/Thr protein kinase)